MSNNPFQILDFLGYFFPGASVMIALYHFVPAIHSSFTITTDTSAIIYIVCIIIAYVIGHIVSLLSSITVEKYAVWKLGYPSYYLLNDYVPNNYITKRKDIKSDAISNKRSSYLAFTKNLLKVIIWFGLLPIAILDVFLSYFFGIDHYYTRKLSNQQIAMIKGKCMILFRTIGIPVSDNKVFEGDNHRIIHNYYYENADKHSTRMDNCIAIYDFLRAMTLVMCVIFMIVFVRSIKTIDFNLSVDWFQIGLLSILAILSYIFYMGFLKFYRKFTVENFMCLICDRDLDFPKKDGPVLFTTGNGVTNDSGSQFTINK